MTWTWGQLAKWRRSVELRSPQAWRPVSTKRPGFLAPQSVTGTVLQVCILVAIPDGKTPVFIWATESEVSMSVFWVSGAFCKSSALILHECGSRFNSSTHCFFSFGPVVAPILSLSVAVTPSCWMKTSHEVFGLTQPTTWRGAEWRLWEFPDYNRNTDDNYHSTFKKLWFVQLGLIYIYTHSISQKWVHPSLFCKYLIIYFQATTLKKWHFSTM